MALTRRVLPFLIASILLICPATAQQSYLTPVGCDDPNPPEGVYGYACNAPQNNCTAYATYTVQSTSTYNTPLTISALLNADAAQTLSLNNITSATATLQPNTTLILQLRCACNRNHSQADAVYVVQNRDTYYSIATDRYQSLTTCNAMIAQNSVSADNLNAGDNLTVPLRCACPTAEQTAAGTKFLVTYAVQTGDDLDSIAGRFGVSVAGILAANNLTGQTSPTIYADSSLLVPLRQKPTVLVSSPPAAPEPPAATPAESSSRRVSWISVGVGIGVGVGAICSVIVGICICRSRRSRGRKPRPLGGNIEKLAIESKSIAVITAGPRQYTPKEICAATMDFSVANRCAPSTSVYRGELGGQLVAVKRADGDVTENVRALSKLKHFNLIDFLGYCSGDGKSGGSLVFEYAKKGSLTEWLAGPQRSALTWQERVQVAMDVANGLNYLHEFAEPGYVHRDVCDANVLLDGNFRAKLTNFWRARADGGEGRHVLKVTRHVAGTRGYMAPEYASDGVVTSKADVFSFGVLLLQLLSGRRAVEGQRMLWKDFQAVFEHEETVSGFIDEAIKGDCSVEEAVGFCGVARSCIALDLNARPSISHVIIALTPYL